jgi:hypothetical protein
MQGPFEDRIRRPTDMFPSFFSQFFHFISVFASLMTKRKAETFMIGILQGKRELPFAPVLAVTF